MIKNEQGQVALVYRQPIPRHVEVGGVVYFFDVKRAVSLAWVNEEHLGKILSLTKVCCGGNVRNLYNYATPSQVNVWSGKGR
jgi:hypothetical protein